MSDQDIYTIKIQSSGGITAQEMDDGEFPVEIERFEGDRFAVVCYEWSATFSTIFAAMEYSKSLARREMAHVIIDMETDVQYVSTHDTLLRADGGSRVVIDGEVEIVNEIVELMR